MRKSDEYINVPKEQLEDNELTHNIAVWENKIKAKRNVDNLKWTMHQKMKLIWMPLDRYESAHIHLIDLFKISALCTLFFK